MNSFDLKAVLNASDPATQEYFSSLIGNKEITKTSATTGSGRGTTTTSKVEKRAVAPEEFARLKDKLIFIYKNGLLKQKKNYYFRK